MAAASWESAQWALDRWGSPLPGDLILLPPTGQGRPTGQGDWSLVIELMLPTNSAAAIWGVSTWPQAIPLLRSAEWAQLGWVDVTDAVRGMEWDRGSDEVYGRPRVGEIRLTLDDRSGTFSPWSSAFAQYLAPGTLMRAGLTSPTGIALNNAYGRRRWIPLWTGLVTEWASRLSEAAADRYAEVTLNETVRDLAQVDGNALPAPVGSGESPADRAARLLDETSWPYGLLIEAENLLAGSLYPLQSTVMAQNRIAELYLVADSSDTDFRSIRDGRAALTGAEYAGTTTDADPRVWPLALISWINDPDSFPDLFSIPHLILDRDDSLESNAVAVAYRPETFDSSSMDQEISNVVSIGRVGGAAQVFRQETSIQRFGPRFYTRADYLNTTDDRPAEFAELISARRALCALKVEAVTVDTWARPLRQFLAMIAVEPTDSAEIRYPLGTDPRPSILGRVASVLHRASPRVSSESMLWETEIRLDSREVVGVPGAQLPPS